MTAKQTKRIVRMSLQVSVIDRQGTTRMMPEQAVGFFEVYRGVRHIPNIQLNFDPQH